MKSCVLTCVIVSALLGCADAQPKVVASKVETPVPTSTSNSEIRLAETSHQQGVAAFRRGDHQTAYRVWQALAEQGNASAQTSLGLLYAKGRGVQQSYAKSKIWMEKSAAQGHAEAQYSLGVFYDQGLGVEKDYDQAAKWYFKAMKRGHARAFHNLGDMKFKGRGMQTDYALAHAFFSLAAELGRRKSADNRDIAAIRLTPSQLVFSRAQQNHWRTIWKIFKSRTKKSIR